MQDDVERVARAIVRAKNMRRVFSEGYTLEDEIENAWDLWVNEARAAMAATREIDAEALRADAIGGDNWLSFNDASAEVADWLQQRANDVKGCGNG